MTHSILSDRQSSSLDGPQQEEQQEAGQDQSEESGEELTATAASTSIAGPSSSAALQSSARLPKRKSRDVPELYLERKETRKQQRDRE